MFGLATRKQVPNLSANVLRVVDTFMSNTSILFAFPRTASVLIVLVAFVTLPVSSDAQVVRDISETSLTQLVQRSWQNSDGLPQNTVSAIEQSIDGYLWFGTDEGLVRFNGTQLVVFDAASSDAFAENQSIRALEVRRDGSLWIGTDGSGLVVYRHGTFEPKSPELTGALKKVIALHEDRSGTLWIGTFDDGLWMLRPGQDRPRQLFTHSVVRSIAEDSHGNIFAGTQEGLIRILPSGEFAAFGTGKSKASPIHAVFVDRHDRVWYSTREGIFRLDDSERQSSVSATPGLAFIEDGQGQIWIGMDGEGLLRIDGESRESLTSEHGLTHDRIISLFQDREGSVWVGSEGGGIVQLNVGQFVNFGIQEGLLSELILTVDAAEDGSIWAGTEGGGLYRIRDGQIKRYGAADGLKDNIVTSLAETGGTVWVGTYKGGLYRIDRRGTANIGVADGLPEGVVAAIEPASDRSLWVGTDGGLSRIQNSKITTYTTDDGLGSNYVTAIKESRDGDIWIGTYKGLFVYDGSQIIAAETESDNTILSISEDAAGRIWVTTPFNGIYIKDGRNWSQFARRNGLPSNNIYQVVFDNRGDVWMTSNKGLYVGNVDAVVNAAQSGESADVATKTAADGLRSNEFNGGVQPAGTIDNTGRLWFPTIRGLASIDPSRSDGLDTGPPVLIEHIDVNGTDGSDHLSDGVLVLAPGEKKIEFSVATLSFTKPERIYIEYRLDGQDDDWLRITPGQKITYTNLAPGQYDLVLRSVLSGRDDKLGPVLTMPVVLQPFLHQRASFWIAMLLFIGLAIYSIHRIRIKSVTRREQLKNAELEKIVVQRTSELRSLNENLAETVELQVNTLMSERIKFENKLIVARDKALESERLKSTIITNLGHEFRTPITSILGFTDIISEKLEQEDLEFTDYIKQGAQRLLDTVTALMDLSELEASSVSKKPMPISAYDVTMEAASSLRAAAEAKGISLDVIKPSSDISLNSDPQLLRKTLALLINNAVKYTHHGGVRVEIDQAGNDVQISVQDSGIGISQDFMPELFSAFKQESSGADRQYEGCGLGLTVAQRLVTIIGGRIDVESAQGVGSAFTVIVPIEQAKTNGQAPPLPGNQVATAA